MNEVAENTPPLFLNPLVIGLYLQIYSKLYYSFNMFLSKTIGRWWIRCWNIKIIAIFHAVPPWWFSTSTMSPRKRRPMEESPMSMEASSESFRQFRDLRPLGGPGCYTSMSYDIIYIYNRLIQRCMYVLYIESCTIYMICTMTMMYCVLCTMYCLNIWKQQPPSNNLFHSGRPGIQTTKPGY